ncbi:hypothetical protein [Streptomyces lutosisoli]|uniref:Uncharacterized protein n=1 Tax=Streptomyces lutosisoli TaxID=2665721 RepID=A0ABW2VUP7_9ACTN
MSRGRREDFATPAPPLAYLKESLDRCSGRAGASGEELKGGVRSGELPGYLIPGEGEVLLPVQVLSCL